MMGSTSPSPPTTNGEYYHNSCSTNHATSNGSSSSPPSKLRILHLGDSICYNQDIEARIASKFDIIHPDPEDLLRSTFIQRLKDRTWGDFDAIMKPFWSSGNIGRWNDEVIQHLPGRMKIMACAGAGFDWVDTQALAERGIIYCNGAHASTESVANAALLHIYSVFTFFMWSTTAARSGSPRMWQEAHTDIPLKARNPQGHKLGIVGLGNIGFAIARKVRAAFNMDILYTDLVQKPSQEQEVSATFYPSLNDMLPHCDALLLATPGGKPIITPDTLARLPDGARLVNIARGSLVQEEALADAIESGHISAAALDVHENEPNVNPRLRKMDRQVQLTCHTGGASLETNNGFERLVMENVEAVLEGRQAKTAVNLHFMHQTNGESHVNGATTNGVAANGQVNGH
ncbi:uncharacterized protein KY384_000716 [Bacidia gigantensis]|uniref:uncharacterized protein n=1 Tax=Bacidia gigantensis TaxID=2732470 RepID=UPI001D049AB6|nr:uncharacterized protein KY384_000716 [Bacidia gigantensis]KAG8525954.1 hypothetical protein KY384_000716 [Bacidia gigantensis]